MWFKMAAEISQDTVVLGELNNLTNASPRALLPAVFNSFKPGDTYALFDLALLGSDNDLPPVRCKFIP